MKIGNFEIVWVPFFLWWYKGGCNFNGEEIFDSIQIGWGEFRIYRSKEMYLKWNKK